MPLCAYCEDTKAIVVCGGISDAWEGEPLCGLCWGLVLADPDEPRLVGDAEDDPDTTP